VGCPLRSPDGLNLVGIDADVPVSMDIDHIQGRQSGGRCLKLDGSHQPDEPTTLGDHRALQKAFEIEQCAAPGRDRNVAADD
jgi:hypothetical protein